MVVVDTDTDLLRGWKEIAAVLKCASSTARGFEREHKLPIIRIGAVIYASRKDLQAWLARYNAQRRAATRNDL